MFGLSKLCNLKILISQNIRGSDHVLQGEALLDSHIQFDNSIKKVCLAYRFNYLQQLT
jgi:hypothetical protein